jgi:hypothetical protein
MNCEAVKMFLPEYIDGRLDKEKEIIISVHLESCSKCSQEMQEMQGFLSFLGRMPNAEVPSDMAEEFATLMDAAEFNGYKRSISIPMWAKIAASVLLVLGTFTGGYFSGIQKNSMVQQQLAADLSAQKQQLLLASLRDYSAPQKIEAVYSVSNTKEISGDLVDALVNTMNRDRNANVRLAAIMALAGMVEKESRVKDELIKSLSIQENPLIQISLIQVLTEKGIREARQPIENMTNNEKTDASVKAFAKDMIKVII